ncbi:RagB/SusD family nutrient uptake outer membrane protein [Winogradskyella flava]|uniref:RagB/SusD family nutrient uptake outer membrane protein n=1 Tax=Winogradskyella flava TaxID=1884876 RepID=A0A842IXV4_9FLAO|nr:RagB/SusD family nutrient uptake outer membrane protein [Winogradskyella flava]MBC2846503.1 RagB/SusD family nutrient uptake outer membrane protein [Winogradskyella flava]
MKFKKIITLLFVAALFSACGDDDIFQEDPDSIVIENFYQTQSDFENAIRGVYSRMKTTGYYGGSGAAQDLIVVGDLLSDNLITNPNGRGTNFQSHNWLYNDNTLPTNMYLQSYRAISRANLILENIDNLIDSDFKNTIRAEALALRAALHFDVARFFSQIPTQSAGANGSLGVAYETAFDPLSAPARLSTVQEVYDLVNADLDLALSLIGDGNSDVTIRFNQNTIRGLISRVALHQGDYARVISTAASVATSVSPAPASALAALWTSASSDGVLFELPFIVSDPLLDTNYSQGSGQSLIPEWSVDADFYATYDQATEPERIAAYFIELNNTGLGEEWILVNKYINGALQQGLNNGRYLRVEEVILNVAEAYYMNNNEPMALQTLNTLRNARYSSFTGGESGDALFDAIMSERRKELAFESSDRWFTLKRLQGVSGIPAAYTQGVQRTGNGHLSNGGGVVPPGQTLNAGDFKWQLPMQQTWLIENPNLEQNPGY